MTAARLAARRRQTAPLRFVARSVGCLRHAELGCVRARHRADAVWRTPEEGVKDVDLRLMFCLLLLLVSACSAPTYAALR